MFPVEAFQSTLGKAADIFRQLAIRFHLTGGVSSVLYGEPRMTQDIDIVADNRALQAIPTYTGSESCSIINAIWWVA